ncbi:uncharacterized protein LOC143144111 isoform X2 [Ptiloglossa arizonensis]|uniref:uncharacterized protein LOC143144111 isoform X2 n=1 Tax=Ptiloglossa arizonensis TaxID=3350558 RepID=UPI003FA17363
MDRGDASSARRSFEPIDCAVFAGMLAISAIVGVYQAYKSRKNTDAVGEYLMGGRNMSIFPISMSLIASYVSGIAILGLPAEIYVHGTQFWCVIVADSLVSLTMAFVYLPVFYDLGIDSSYEYLKLRFNNAVRLTGTVIFLLKMVSSNRPRSSAVEILPRETLVPVALHSAGDIRSRAGVQSSDGHQPPRDRSTGLHRLHILHDLGRAQGGRVDRRYSNDRHVRRSGDRRGSRDVAGRRGPTSLGEKPRDRQNRLLRHGSGPDGAAHLLDRGRRRLLQLVGELLGQPGNGAEMLVDARREEGQRVSRNPNRYPSVSLSPSLSLSVCRLLQNDRDNGDRDNEHRLVELLHRPRNFRGVSRLRPHRHQALEQTGPTVALLRDGDGRLDPRFARTVRRRCLQRRAQHNVDRAERHVRSDIRGHDKTVAARARLGNDRRPNDQGHGGRDRRPLRGTRLPRGEAHRTDPGRQELVGDNGRTLARNVHPRHVLPVREFRGCVGRRAGQPEPGRLDLVRYSGSHLRRTDRVPREARLRRRMLGRAQGSGRESHDPPRNRDKGAALLPLQNVLPLVHLGRIFDRRAARFARLLDHRREPTQTGRRETLHAGGTKISALESSGRPPRGTRPDGNESLETVTSTRGNRGRKERIDRNAAAEHAETIYVHVYFQIAILTRQTITNVRRSE